MGGKLTIRMVGLRVVLGCCVFIGCAGFYTAFGQSASSWAVSSRLVEKAGTVRMLPDAPGVEIPTQRSPIQDTFANRDLPGSNSAAAVSAQLRSAFEAAQRPVTELGPESFSRPSEFDANPGERIVDPNEFWTKLLPPASHSVSRYHFSDSNSLFGRATHAASSVAILRDDSGEARLNTTYFLRVLASAVAHSASRPYWKRSLSQPFSDFGATIGNDAGMNVLHEFSPGIMQAMKNHEPRFVTHIGQRFHHN